MNNLLVNKIRGNRKTGAVWRCYPHVVLRFDSEKCLSLLTCPVWGASANIGRSLSSGTEPEFTRYDNYDAMMSDGVQEILILADSIPGRMLPLSTLESIEVFSQADQQLVEEYLAHAPFSGIQVALSHACGGLAGYRLTDLAGTIRLADD